MLKIEETRVGMVAYTSSSVLGRLCLKNKKRKKERTERERGRRVGDKKKMITAKNDGPQKSDHKLQASKSAQVH